MPAKIFSIINQSGGAGKTTLAHNLGYHVAANNNKVLLVDMDPQASLTTFMGLAEVKITLENNIYGAITERTPIKVWDEEINHMSIIPTNQELAFAERELLQDVMIDNRMRLKMALDKIKDQFDYIFLDCPPALGLLSVMALIASEKVIIPLQTQYKTYMGTRELLGTIYRIKNAGHSSLEINCIVPMMFDGRNTQDTSILKEVQNQVKDVIYVTPPIPRSTAFPDASQNNVPLALHKKNHPSVEILEKIAKHIISS
ncbi:MAG: ParA family protein [Scytonematopsis contorta HA4267-MV1]|jgi:chromosome partitioning protein|nr:ParA family protein [Scytonematopsis contorta HA4267-MV1]